MSAGVGSYNNAREAEAFADDGRVEGGGETVDDEAGKRGAEHHSEDTDESEEADYQRGIVICWAREEESEGGPVASESGGGAETYEAGLD